MEIRLLRNTADQFSLVEHLLICDEYHVPELSKRVDLVTYSAKLASRAELFEAWAGHQLVGLVAGYLDAPFPASIFVTNVSVTPDNGGRGIAKRLLGELVEFGRAAEFQEIVLRVNTQNTKARKLYEIFGFKTNLALDRHELELKLDLRK